MHKTTSKVKTQTRKLNKSTKRFTAYSDTQWKYSFVLENDDTVLSIEPNILININDCNFTTDFLCVRTDNSKFVVECISSKQMWKPMIMRELDESRTYWINHGIDDFVLVIGKIEGYDYES